MAEEEVVVVATASPAPSDHKRKLEDLEPDAPKPLTADLNVSPESESAMNADDDEEPGGVDESEAKRPRLEDNNSDPPATENGYQEGKVDELHEEVDTEQQAALENNVQSEDVQEPTIDSLERDDSEQPAADDHQTHDFQSSDEEVKPQMENANAEELEQSKGELQEPSAEVATQGDVSSAGQEKQQQSTSESQTMSRKMEVSNTKVGVLIGKAGDTIRFLQLNSGAKIQITRDAEADLSSTTRPVELIGSLESINKAEKLIKDVIAEADAGGSPSLVARGFSTVQATGVGEQIQIQVPNEKVGLIIGKGGETIKNLQTRSGARIQLIPQHLPEGDQSKERTVRVTGDKKQIEMAREMIKEAMNQPIRPSPLSGGYNQQGFRPRGSAVPQWGPRATHPAQPIGYDYQQRGPYPSQNPPFAPSTYGNYPQHQLASRSNFGPGWDQRLPTTVHGPPQAGGHDYYAGQGGHMSNVPAPGPPSNPIHSHVTGPSPTPFMGPLPSQANYNYGQPQGPDYGHPTPYSQTAPPTQSYGHGYGEAKYDSQAMMQHPYGAHGGPQPSAYPQGGMHPGYGQQEQYGKPPSYSMPLQGSLSQPYGQPRANQPGDVPYQGHASSNQPYGSNATPQQPYPYASSGPMQQTYPQFGSAAASDGYNQPPPATASAPGYHQQGGPPVSGYGQPGGQQAIGYAQMAPTGGYGAYPSSQPAPNNAVYGYQGPADQAYGSGPGSAYSAIPSGQLGYPQPAPTQPGYDQSIPQSGGYGSVPASAPVGYGKSVSPQPAYPQYDSSQTYGAHR